MYVVKSKMFFLYSKFTPKLFSNLNFLTAIDKRLLASIKLSSLSCIYFDKLIPALSDCAYILKNFKCILSCDNH